MSPAANTWVAQLACSTPAWEPGTCVWLSSGCGEPGELLVEHPECTGYI